jgi:hypothetical protein
LVGDGACAYTDRRALEIDVSPAKREKLAAAQAGERGGEEDGAVHLGGRGSDQAPHLFGRKHLDVAAARQPKTIDVGHRIARQLPHLDRVPEDRMQ